MVKDWTMEEHQRLRRQVPKDALQTSFRSTTVQVPGIAGLQNSLDSSISRVEKACSFTGWGSATADPSPCSRCDPLSTS